MRPVPYAQTKPDRPTITNTNYSAKHKAFNVYDHFQSSKAQRYAIYPQFWAFMPDVPADAPVTGDDEAVLRAMWRNNLNAAAAARELHYHRNSVAYHVRNIYRKTGFDCRNFYDAVELLKLYGEGSDANEEDDRR